MTSLTRTPSGKLRARGIGLTFAGTPGPNNAITDVPGVTVGYETLIEGDSVRTGVTAILPRPKQDLATSVFAGCHSLNGNGELTGSHWIQEAGCCDGPITITNTHALGTCRDASIQWMVTHQGVSGWALPVAGETYDGTLNDINGFHIKPHHVFAAIDQARDGPIDEGSVGGGTGMICYGFKGGSGTASRALTLANTVVTLGVFVQANFGLTSQLTIAGIPVGQHLANAHEDPERGSIIAVVATDAPLLPHQLKRLTRRVGLGMGRSGAISGHGSGDLFLAFSTANKTAHQNDDQLSNMQFIPDALLDPLFEAVIQAVDEAILNAMVANEPMTGFKGARVEALPIKQVLNLMARS
ncbi:P1 family peptidase [Pseudomonadales bacterium]|nr:P1 family peptidase [Pseudomonadales bacterium]